ncbi:VWA domain-containing protein [Flavobacterium sp. SM15]|uniref:vWA domain-containing protein n=1 Tax=Flavobacterium sp. SM15 TaxID=2908005 RepID=UPI001EDC4A42|nr:vWA domain-containing protein [Flavobacterium sp. SM15]MCG2612209.1 VWA domain-containing protein [Flavobacterium sp. SM15]
MKSTFIITALFATAFTFANCTNSNHKETSKTLTSASTIEKPIKVENTKIQVAILLDTSNSMDGLIEQAKSRLWNIVNTLTTLKYHGKTPDIEIGLYEYGNDGLSQESNYIRQVAPLTTDLDLISEKLFSLRTNGGSEYCGAVIADATKQLNWGKDASNMKLVYIAGNEAFNQGGVNYKEAISDALKKDIYINTIFCGNQEEGIRTFWKDGADAGKGKYFNIDSNKAVIYIATPYDVRISECNTRINTTYISYGSMGYEKKMNQAAQDSNAQGVSAANFAERTVSKSKAVYKNDSWDLVDKVKDDKGAIDKLKKEELPKELQNKSKAEIKVYVDQKSKEREAIQKEIGELGKKRQAFIDAEMKKTNSQDDLGGAINSSVIAFAKTKGYTVEK